ncbi:MAG: acyl-CoA dehydratase activase [Desulfobacterales bacterium]|jgi:predicted CoA-substrate-specific enzyme activase
MEKMNSKKYSVGIDIGSVSLNCIVIDECKKIVFESAYKRHFGKIDEEMFSLVEELFEKFGEKQIQSISFTGSHGKKLAERLGVFYEFETISQVLGTLYLIPDAKSLICMGGQDTALLQIHHQGDRWELESFNANGPCASGTGSFIDQQAERLATVLYEKNRQTSQNHIDRILNDFIRLGLKSEKPANVACRCTVFTKSDMIHLQNKGEKLEDIIYGLHVGNARNYVSTIVSNQRLEDPIVFVGGLSKNELQVKAFRAYYPDLIVPPHNTSTGALGVALKALELKKADTFNLDDLKKASLRGDIAVPRAPRLVLKKTKLPEAGQSREKFLAIRTKVYLGIDIGSTTTKYALIDEKHSLIHKNYVHTRGKPIEVTQQLLKHIADELGGKVEIMGVATTGSGRYVVGDFLNADLTIDEITAHARGAVEINPEVDTIFEIGGQDSKYISLVNANPLDFDMNKVCAAGTGSFLHELANKYGINIVGEFQDIALSSRTPVKLTDRCTVFMESDLVSYYQKGASREDLMAGLCYAIVHNYLNRVVGKRQIGQRIMFLGGPSLNKGVVAAFENVLGRGLLVPRHREVLGAYGAAICVRQKMKAEGKDRSAFRGMQSAIDDRMNFKEKVCRADPNCHNQCKLKIYQFDNRRSIWGGECGRHELARTRSKRKDDFFKLRRMLWETHMAGVYTELDDQPLMEIEGRPTIGMQRALYGHHTAILWAHFFDRLGYRLVLTPPTSARISSRGVEKAVEGVCYPVKVSYGHIELLAGKTRYLFLPSLIKMPTPKPSETGFYCPMVQSNSYMVRMAYGLDRASILNPVIHLKHDPETLAVEIYRQMGTRLGLSKKRVKKSLTHAIEKQRQFAADMHQQGDKILRKLDPAEPIMVVTGRPYNLYDDRLNLRLGQNLARLGIAALPMDFIDSAAVDLTEFPSMFWGLGAQILKTAKIVAGTANYFGLHLTNFGCGADSFIEHFYKSIMGDKAYLILELDEHSAAAGVMTRLEAYKNVIENSMQAALLETQFKTSTSQKR